MKKIITIISLLLSLYAKAQSFSGPGGGITNNGENTYFNLPVSGLSPLALDSTFGLEDVCVNINHPNVEELYLYLESPGGTIVELTEGSSCNGNSYTNTCFNSTAGSSVTLGAAPYTGSFRPIGSLGRFQNGQAGNGTWKLIVKDYLAFVDSGNVVSWSLNFGTSPAHSVLFTSSNLPIVIINTGSAVVSDTDKLVTMGVIYNGAGVRNHLGDVWNNYNAKATIHIRGNTSKNFEKKPYSLETRDLTGAVFNSSILGMPPENDWDLIASYQDKSLIRIPLTYDLFRKMGHYASRFKNVEVVMNNQYQGVYAFVEKLKRDNNRIDIAKLTPTDNAYPDVTGGYILEIDRPESPGWFSFLPGNSPTGSHFYYQYVYPKDSDITVQQQTYIQSFVDSFEVTMNSPNFADPTVGYQKYIDVGSFIDFFIINELSKNVDAYRLSTYLYKDKITAGGKLHIGPVWDYDIAWHNCNYGDSFDPDYWQYQSQDSIHPPPTWWGRFMQDTNFVNRLYCRWNDLRQNILSIGNLNAYIDSSANALNESQQRNFIQWPIMGAYIYPNPQNQVGASYSGEVADLKNWIADRIAWMDGAITGHCISAGIDEYVDDNSITVYPNPFQSSTTFVINLTKEADVSLRITDIMGKEISLLLDEHRYSGETKVNFDRGQVASGIYLYQLKINNTIKTGKVILQ